jgi:ubiquinone/menaquinone biosynthesis C-methylase UbiE
MRVVGLELSSRLVAACRRRTTLDVRKALIEAFPHGDSSFDAVMSSMSFHRWVNKPAALGEVARLLRPGGVLVLADLSDDDLMEHTLLRNLLGPFTSQIAPLADRHQWLESAGLRLLYVIATVMDRNVFMTVAERPAA